MFRNRLILALAALATWVGCSEAPGVPTAPDPVLQPASKAVEFDPDYGKLIYDGHNPLDHITEGFVNIAAPRHGYTAVSLKFISHQPGMTISRLTLDVPWRGGSSVEAPTLHISEKADPNVGGLATFSTPQPFPADGAKDYPFVLAEPFELHPGQEYWLHFTGGEWHFSRHQYRPVEEGLQFLGGWNHGTNPNSYFFPDGKWRRQPVLFPGGPQPPLEIYPTIQVWGGVWEEDDPPKHGCGPPVICESLTFGATLKDDPYQPGHDGTPEPISIWFDSKVPSITTDKVKRLIRLSCGSVVRIERVEVGVTPAFDAWVQPCGDEDLIVSMRADRNLRDWQRKHFGGADPITIPGGMAQDY